MAATIPPPAVDSHIVFDEKGRPWIDDTNVKVIEVVEEYLAGMSIEEMQAAHPGMFTTAQLHGALMYFHDHESEMRAEIQRLDAELARIRAETEDVGLQTRLRELKKTLA